MYSGSFTLRDTSTAVLVCVHVHVCMYHCTTINRCSELTRKDKLCENVRRMQHAKVSLGCLWHSFPIIMLMIVCMGALGREEGAVHTLNLKWGISIRKSTWFVQKILCVAALSLSYWEEGRWGWGVSPWLTGLLSCHCDVLPRFSSLLLWSLPAGHQTLQHHSNHVYPARGCQPLPR